MRLWGGAGTFAATRTTLLDGAIAVVIAVGFLAILDRGGNTREAILFQSYVSTLLAVLLIARVLFAPPSAVDTPSYGAMVWVTAAITALVVAAILGRVSLSIDAWLALPGRSVYQAVIATLRDSADERGTLAISMAVDAGLHSILVLFSCAIVAAATATLSTSSRMALMYYLIALGITQSVVGVAQIAFKGASLFTLDYVGHVRATGTFVNKNHFATFLAMLIPFCVSRASAALSELDFRTDRPRLQFVLWCSITVSFVLACASTLSRAGIAAALIVLFLAIGVEVARHSRRTRQRRRAIGAGVVIAVCVGLVLASSESFFNAISDAGAVGSWSARLQMYEGTLRGATALFPLGSGLGSFAVAFPAFQPVSLRGYVEYAHNDYLQLLFEAGALGAIAIGCAAIAVVQATRDCVRREFPPVQTPFGLGALAFAIHALFDFPAHIPALAWMGTFMFVAACSDGKVAKQPSTIHRAD